MVKDDRFQFFEKNNFLIKKISFWILMFLKVAIKYSIFIYRVYRYGQYLTYWSANGYAFCSLFVVTDSFVKETHIFCSQYLDCFNDIWNLNMIFDRCTSLGSFIENSFSLNSQYPHLIYYLKKVSYMRVDPVQFLVLLLLLWSFLFVFFK